MIDELYLTKEKILLVDIIAYFGYLTNSLRYFVILATTARSHDFQSRILAL